MPEGDTLHTLAIALDRWMRGLRIDEVYLEGRPLEELVGRCIERVRARGKHLVIELDDGTRLRTHLAMTGAWHRYSIGEPWEHPKTAASLILRVGSDDYVCFRAAEVEVYLPGSLAELALDRRLGPDLAHEAPDFEQAVDNALASRHPTLGDVLLEQRVACGLGNVYKSELAFLAGLDPRTPAAAIDRTTWLTIFHTGHELLRRNLAGGPRVTRRESELNDERLWVYGRDDRPCHRCGTRLIGARTGRSDRWSTWCPACQTGLEELGGELNTKSC